MSESIIRAKGLTTVPADIRKAIGAHPGTRLVWHAFNNGRLFVRVKKTSVLDLRGTLTPLKGKHVAIENMRP